MVERWRSSGRTLGRGIAQCLGTDAPTSGVDCSHFGKEPTRRVLYREALETSREGLRVTDIETGLCPYGRVNRGPSYRSYRLMLETGVGNVPVARGESCCGKILIYVGVIGQMFDLGAIDSGAIIVALMTLTMQVVYSFGPLQGDSKRH